MGWLPFISYLASLAKFSYVRRVSGSWSNVRAHVILSVMRPMSHLVWYNLRMGTIEFVFWLRGFWKRHVYALLMILRLWGLNCMWTICWWCEPNMVIVVGILILTRVSMIVTMAYVWGGHRYDEFGEL